MNVISRIARSVLVLASVLLLSLVGTSVRASAQVPSQTRTWHLEQFDRTSRMCVQQGPDGRTHASYFIFVVSGKWSTDLKFGMRDLPPGWTATEHYLPPGSNFHRPDGSITVNGFVGVQGPASVPMATYHAHIWVSDGTVTETLPTDIIVTTESWVDCMNRP
ncbi:DUF5980 family protein [Lentzea sp. BCCO 10_0061]|uniref:DUF5980 family protein n=1 Tax=Lentzea sokolovensis TaxID=3095429 RepID=A0ABU4VBT0_9PSEU|nr:DUF5980 family protein [Lentzea sp. BCCO 10_0061]MDX8148817.1 DUF5980 family protein [Lentzea sp. BCCO 10_0061]